MGIRSALFGFCLSVSLISNCAAEAQPAGGKFSFDLDREPVASLDGQWRFHPGDDPRWSQPDFDDNDWTLIRTGQSWYTQGFPHLDGFAWYRATIQIPDKPQDLSLLVPYVVTSYQVFANGQLLGGVGAMPPRKHPIGQFRAWAVYHLPAAAPHAHSMVVAFRIWHPPVWQDFIGGEIDDGLRVGATPLIEQRKETESVRFLWSHGAPFCLALLAFLAACASLGFYLKHRTEKEYLWFTTAQMLYAVYTILDANRMHLVADVALFVLVNGILYAAWGWATMCFFRLLLGGRRDWLFRAILACFAAYGILQAYGTLPALMGSGWTPLSYSYLNEVDIVLNLIPSFWVVGLLLRRAVQGMFDVHGCCSRRSWRNKWRYCWTTCNGFLFTWWDMSPLPTSSFTASGNGRFLSPYRPFASFFSWPAC